MPETIAFYIKACYNHICKTINSFKEYFMKSLKKIATILLVVSLLAALLAIAVAAEGEVEYTGTVDGVTKLLEEFDAAPNSAGRKGRIPKVEAYFRDTPIDPASEGYSEVVIRTVDSLLLVYSEIGATDFASMLKFKNMIAAFANDFPVDYGAERLANVAAVSAIYSERVVAKAEEYANNFTKATTLSARLTALGSIHTHYTNFFTNVECEEYDELMNLAARAYMTCIDEVEELYLKKQHIRNLKNFMEGAPKANWSAETNTKYRSTCAAYDKAFADAKEALVSNAPLGEYSDSYIFCDFSGGASGFKYAYKRTHPVEVLLGDRFDPENKSMTITAADSGQTYFQIDIPAEHQAQTCVLEFDYLAETASAGYLCLQARDQRGGTTYFPNLCWIGPNGIGVSKNKSLVTGQYLKAFVVGEWVHISVVVDNLNNQVKVYVDYVLAGTTDIDIENDLASVRFDHYMTATSKVDNLMYYAGSAPREVNRLKEYSDAERFQFYSTFLDKVSNDEFLPSINIAYNEMTKALPTYWDAANSTYTALANNPDIKAAVDDYLGFDYNSFMNKIKAYNLSNLDDHMDEYKALGRTPSNISARSTMITFIRMFMAMNVFDKENQTYKQYDAFLTQEARNVELDANANAFVNAMNRFALAPVVETMEKYYNVANEYVVQSALDMSVIDDPAFKDLKKAYELYQNAAASILEVRCNAASRRFVTYMSYLENNFENFDKEAVWIENYAIFDQYITACRAILRSGVYTEEYEGWDVAYENYALINEFLYESLQQTHLSEALAMLDRFPEADNYVAKLGVCRYVRNYFAANDVDYTHPEIAAAVIRLEIYEDEVEILGEGYAVVLEQNTQEFISYVQQMKSTKDYSELKAIYNASLDYYYSMNINSAEAMAALADFDVFSKRLITIEQSSAAFIESATGINSLTGDKLYSALVACYSLIDNVSSDIAGIDEAIAAYEEAYAAYEAKTATVNAEISTSSVVICAVRFSPAVKPVAAVIKKIFE